MIKNEIDYLHDHIKQMQNAIDEGVDLIGYQHWSFIVYFIFISRF